LGCNTLIIVGAIAKCHQIAWLQRGPWVCKLDLCPRMNSPLWASGGALFVGLLWMGPALSAGFCKLCGMEVLTNIPFGHDQTCPLSSMGNCACCLEADTCGPLL